MKPCKVFIPFGAVGTGISDEAFARGMELNPDIISSDAGSTDSGPYYLGTGKAKYTREAIKADLAMMVIAAHHAGIPITIGSCGTCGVDEQVDAYAAICDEICREAGFTAKVAKIYSEQTPALLKEKYRIGKVRALEAAPAIDEATFDECSHIVALAGAEPFIKALQDGADIILCGRATDTAVIAALPLLRGCDPAAAWHGAKITECGALCTTNPVNGGVFLTVDDKGFIVEATAADSQCSPYSVSAHLLYENSDPIRLVEPGVVIDTTHSTYKQLENGRVQVTGTVCIPQPYTMKLEGAGPAGYQTITLVGIRDRAIMKQPEAWLNGLTTYVQKKLDRLGIPADTYSYNLRPYGWNAVYGGAVPAGYQPNELGILLTVTGTTQELATKVAKVFNPMLLHFPLEMDRQLPSFAFPFSPAEVERGQIYEFKLHHVIELENPLDGVRIDYAEIGSMKEGI